MSQSSTRSRSGQNPNSESGGNAGSAWGFTSPQTIATLPLMPWNTADSIAAVATVQDFAARLLRGKEGTLYTDERSRPTAVNLLFIISRFQGPGRAEAESEMLFSLAETPGYSNMPRLFRQAASRNLTESNHDMWLTNLVRAIEYGTMQYVAALYSGRKASPQQLQVDIATAEPALIGADSKRRLAICRIAKTAVMVGEFRYGDVAEQLRFIITTLGQEFNLVPDANKLASEIVETDTALAGPRHRAAGQPV